MTPGEIVCLREDGTEFTVANTEVSETENATGDKQLQCVGAEGQLGVVKWQAASGVVDDQTRVLTGRFLRSNSQALADPAACNGAAALRDHRVQRRGRPSLRANHNPKRRLSARHLPRRRTRQRPERQPASLRPDSSLSPASPWTRRNGWRSSSTPARCPFPCAPSRRAK